MPAFRFETAISELIDVPAEEGRHPLITTAKFIFADDRPNGNKQAVPFEEFENIAKSVIGMPVKINFKGFSAKDHAGSQPIGHIKKMDIITSEDGSYHQLVAEASLWTHEFPEIVTWLKDAWASGEAPGISWELLYRESSIREGIEWLRGVIASAATFVESPAYGPRTALLALASIKNPEQYGDNIAQNLIALAEQFKSAPKNDKPKPKGGNRMTEEEIKQLQEALAAKTTEASTKADEIKKLLEEIATKDGEITELQGTVTSLQTAALIDDRVRKYTEVVGPLPAEASEADKVKNLFATFNDEQFEYHLEQLGNLKKSLTPTPSAAEAALKTAQASRRGIEVPKLDPPTTLTYDTLRSGLKSLARPNSAE
jgi:HPt (histidine-containing phosphotransfer) domain-containing protein